MMSSKVPHIRSREFRSVKTARSVLSMAAAMPLTLLIGATDAAATTCFEYVDIPESMDCNSNGSNSADFTTSCKHIAATQEIVPVECPFRWVNTDGKKTHDEVCRSVGLNTASASGQICSSGENRAPDTYNFIFGKWGGVTSGGVSTTSRNDHYYCWHSGQKKDYDSTDIVIAYACGG
mgnify:CR=1 FL=1